MLRGQQKAGEPQRAGCPSLAPAVSTALAAEIPACQDGLLSEYLEERDHQTSTAFLEIAPASKNTWWGVSQQGDRIKVVAHATDNPTCQGIRRPGTRGSSKKAHAIGSICCAHPGCGVHTCVSGELVIACFDCAMVSGPNTLRSAQKSTMDDSRCITCMDISQILPRPSMLSADLFYRRMHSLLCLAKGCHHC